MRVSQLSKFALALSFGLGSLAAVVATEAANPAEPGATTSAMLSGQSAPALAQGYGYRGGYGWHGRHYQHRRWHHGYWGPYHRWHPGFWVYF
jgi:hypothetical protein